MRRISSPIEAMKEHYDAVVIGSGYGGGIAASRMSRAGKKVCLLERGREIVPGEYPDTVVEATEEVQFHTPDKQIGKKTGLFDFHVQEDINVLVGCGLGGTSLINANVSLRAVPGVWNDPRWPSELRGGKVPTVANRERVIRRRSAAEPGPRQGERDVRPGSARRQRPKLC